MLFFIICSCLGQDYDVSSTKEEQSSGDEQPSYFVTSAYQNLIDTIEIPNDNDHISTEPEEIQMRVDIALQRLMWGEDLGRCQLQISFERREYEPRTNQGSQNQTAYPEEEGTCAFTRFDEQAPFVDRWYVSGDLYGPQQIYLHGESVLTLELMIAEDGQLRYELQDCSDEVFPFSQVLGIEIPGSEGGEWEVPGLWIDDAFVVGPDIRLLSPNNIAEDHRFHGYGGDDLQLEWALQSEVPEHRGEQLEAEIDVRLYNNQKNGWSGLESMVCLPYSDSNSMVITGSNLSQFTLNDTLDQDEYFTAIAVQSIVRSTEFVDPWGRIVQVRSLISEGGMMELVTSE
jgi:hypothetical protein